MINADSILKVIAFVFCFCLFFFGEKSGLTVLLESEEEAARVVERLVVLGAQRLVDAAQLADLLGAGALADADEAEAAPVRLEVAPLVVLHRIGAHEARVHLATEKKSNTSSSPFS